MKTNLMKSILHLKDDTEYQIPLKEKGGRAKVGTTTANPVVDANKETEVEDQQNSEASEEKVIATQSQDGSIAEEKPNKISPEEIDALPDVEEDPDEPQNREQPSTEESSSNATTESVPQVDSAKAALDEMKKLASQEGVVHPSLFISNFSKILGLMERAMQLQVKESGSATKESGSAPKATEQPETPAEG